MEEELEEAEKAKDWSGVFRYARQLAGTRRGPKRRPFNVPAADAPAAEEWAEHMAKDGPQGGCRAKVVATTAPGKEGYEYKGFTSIGGWEAEIENEKKDKRVNQWLRTTQRLTKLTSLESLKKQEGTT